MKAYISSIFNDVIGPVMRGPSSSHVAAAARIGDIVAQSLLRDVKRVEVDFDIRGALIESYHGQGTDIGFISGLLNIPLTDSRVADTCEIAKELGIEVNFNFCDYGEEHPNFHRVTAFNNVDHFHVWDAISTGGGMVKMLKYDGFPVNIVGDFYEILVTFSNINNDYKEKVSSLLSYLEASSLEINEEKSLVNCKCSQAVLKETITELKALENVKDVVYITPVLPTKSVADTKVPFSTAAELLEYAKTDVREPWQYASLYESKRGNVSEEAVFQQMFDLVTIMENAIATGLAKTNYENRILGPQAYLMESAAEKNILIPCDILNNTIKCITAIMEVKSSMGVIIAAPTAGSCGCLPGTIIGVAETQKMSKEDMTKAMLTAGLIGIFIAEAATFSAEVAGCQVECGAGSAMASGGLIQLFGGSIEQVVDASSMALQNISGLICDPVANGVEVPCLGKNVLGGSNAISTANMILAGYDKVIPLDETIAAIYDIGVKLPIELRCTLGGIGKTPTALAIRDKFKALGLS